MADARDVIARTVWWNPDSELWAVLDDDGEIKEEFDDMPGAVLAALHDAGFVVVERRPVTVHESMAEEWDRYKPALDYLADK